MQRVDQASLSCAIQEGRHVVNLLPELHVVVAQLVQLIYQSLNLLRVRSVIFRIFSLGSRALIWISFSLVHHFLRLRNLRLRLVMLSKCESQLLLELFDLHLRLLEVHLTFLQP